MTNHGFGYIYRHVLAAIMHGDGVTHHFREDGAGTRPGLDDVLAARFIHRIDATEKARFHKRTFFKLLLTLTPSLLRYFLRRRMIRRLEAFFVLRVR